MVYRLITLSLFLAVGAWPQRAPKGMSRPGVAKPRPERGPDGGAPAPRRASDVLIDKLQNMSPQDRKKALATLPPERRTRIESGLNRLQNLSPDQRKQLE